LGKNPHIPATHTLRKASPEFTEKRRRLLLYLQPRWPHLELAGVMAAIKQGEDDLLKMSQHTTMCLDKCPASRPGSSDCSQACWKEDPYKPRIMTCMTLDDWLPY
jgi:hypothetical protein